MTALLVVCALGSIALGCYLVYLVSGELRPSGTVIGMRQRYARANRDTAVFIFSDVLVADIRIIGFPRPPAWEGGLLLPCEVVAPSLRLIGGERPDDRRPPVSALVQGLQVMKPPALGGEQVVQQEQLRVLRRL